MKNQNATKDEMTPGESLAYSIGLFAGFMLGIGLYLLLELLFWMIAR